VGLKSLFNRAHMIGANLDIKSESDKGTVVEVRLRPELIKTA
jgi:signal transduction histidine kinase